MCRDATYESGIVDLYILMVACKQIQDAKVFECGKLFAKSQIEKLKFMDIIPMPLHPHM